METEKTEAAPVDSQNDGGEGTSAEDAVSIPRMEYNTLNQTLGSLKKELKDLKKAQAEVKETPQTKPEDFGLLQKAYLRAVGVTDEEEIELAKDIQKKTGMDWDKLVDDDYFKHKLEGLKASKANAVATSNVRGSGGTAQAKYTPEYWLAKGNPPSAEEVPDRKLRGQIARAFMDSAKSKKMFYND